MLRLNSICKSYQMGEYTVHALRNVSLTIEHGEFIAIIGTSGSGKSTLMHTIGLLDRPESGTYEIDGQDVTKLSDTQTARLRNRTIGFIFQQFNLLQRASALENVNLPLLYSGKTSEGLRGQKMLERVGLGDRMHHRPNELSGGQQQRVAIARALVNNPSIILADEPTGNLDSKSSKDIMSLFRALHRQGLTVVLVTHDIEVAEHADRIITIRDGEIQEDRRNETPVIHEGAKEEVLELLRASAQRRSWLAVVHEGTALTRQSLRALWNNKARTFLSALGILIGVAAVIAMVSLALGAKASVKEQLARLGSNLLNIHPASRSVQGVRLQAGDVSRMVLSDTSAIAEKIPSVKRAAASVRGNVQLQYGSKNWATSVSGVSPDYAPMRSEVPTLGRYITDDDILNRAQVAVIGMTPLRNLFGENENPIGKTIRVNRRSYEIIGVLPERGSSAFGDQDDTVRIPITTAMYRLLGKRYIDNIDAEIDTVENIPQAQDDIQTLMATRHGKNPSENPFDIRNMAEIQAALGSTTKIMSILLASIAGISLIVGGIGIMNIMLVSVTERTREIGLRKAIGARRQDIMAQFLIEALAISLLGGLSGLALGVGLSLGMAKGAGWPMEISNLSIIVAFGFSVFIGIFFGLWPAMKASKLDSIEALRYE
ncbi:MAG: ATP-binding cassette domain-containing protein [Kiritimatiellaceae bacterium]|nr:ATP-binding cassette domain-containing protein [Kiritimatiellaceae bacterium]